MALYEPIFRALEAAETRYVVVGGVATVLHGHARLTADLDLIVDLEPEAARRTCEVLAGLGLVPLAPVPLAAFADPDQRRRWVTEKGMRVFSLYNPRRPLPAVDLFVESPIPFDELWSRSRRVALGDTHARVVSLDDLIRLKELAGRPQDHDDIAKLRAIAEQVGHEEGT